MGYYAFVAELFGHVAADGGAHLQLVVGVEAAQVLHIGCDGFTDHYGLSKADTLESVEVGATTPGLFFSLVMT